MPGFFQIKPDERYFLTKRVRSHYLDPSKQAMRSNKTIIQIARTIALLIIPLLDADTPFAQHHIDSINKKEVSRIINYLAADRLKGRTNGSEEQIEVARFLANELTSYGIDTVPGFDGFLHEFPVTINDQTKRLFNVVGLLRGKSKPGEIVIISAHYDHINGSGNGVIEPDEIFNGANDNASGTTAVLLLSKYFSARNDNERTIIFCLFAGEEIGLLGSKALAGPAEKDSIKAVINIEMIGRANWSGKNAFVVCGTRYTSIDEILKKNLEQSGFKVRNDYADRNFLYERSDHYSFALKGIPAVTIMCSDDTDLCYHRPCDEVKRLDLGNMVKVIQAIAKGSESIVSGKDTPVITQE